MALDPYETGILVMSHPVWMLGTELRSSARAVHTPKPRPISPATCYLFCYVQVCAEINYLFIVWAPGLKLRLSGLAMVAWPPESSHQLSTDLEGKVYWGNLLFCFVF